MRRRTLEMSRCLQVRTLQSKTIIQSIRQAACHRRYHWVTRGMAKTMAWNLLITAVKSLAQFSGCLTDSQNGGLAVHNLRDSGLVLQMPSSIGNFRTLLFRRTSNIYAICQYTLVLGSEYDRYRSRQRPRHRCDSCCEISFPPANFKLKRD